MRSITRRFLFLTYALALLVSLVVSYELRFDFAVPRDIVHTFPLTFAWMLCLKLGFLWWFGQFVVLPGYFSSRDFSRLLGVLSLSGLIALALSAQLGWNYAPPRGVVVADFSLSVLALTAVRMALCSLRARALAQRRQDHPSRARRAGIIGAGVVGSALAQDFASRPELGLQAVAFFDDDRTKWGTRIHDIPVVGGPELLRDDTLNLELEEIVIAMPSAPAKRISALIGMLQQLQLRFKSVPSMYDLTTGRAKVSQLRVVEADELLGRHQVQLATEDIREILSDRVVLVTGAGGSIGSELCRQIAACGPASLLLLEQSEVQLFQIEQELIESGFGKQIIPLVANVMDFPRLTRILRHYRPSLVFHAAAHKHVPLMERQPGEAIKNNALGTLRLAQASLEAGVSRFILISSDKAINPTNVMGATKRLAEMCVQSMFAYYPHRTRFMAVRFGNVLGSSGSVVPIFTKQIAAGGPVKVTHPDVTRYFMTIPEAVGLVLQAGALGQGGEIFTLDMGQPVRILELAKHLISLSGFVPDKDIHIEFTGLRPGEKLFEELSYKGESITHTRHPKIMRLLCEPQPLENVRSLILALAEQADRLESNQLKRALRLAVPEYQPQLQEATTPTLTTVNGRSLARNRDESAAQTPPNGVAARLDEDDEDSGPNGHATWMPAQRG